MNKWLAQFELSGKVAAITGAGGALCGTMARALGSMGVKVALIDLKPDAAGAVADEVITSGGSAEAFECDVLDTASLEAVRSALAGGWGPLFRSLRR